MASRKNSAKPKSKKSAPSPTALLIRAANRRINTLDQILTECVRDVHTLQEENRKVMAEQMHLAGEIVELKKRIDAAVPAEPTDPAHSEN